MRQEKTALAKSALCLHSNDNSNCCREPALVEELDTPKNRVVGVILFLIQ